MLQIEFKTMGCRARAFVDADGRAAEAALGALPGWFAKREAALSRFDSASPLSRLNARGFADGLDETLWAGIDVALISAAASDGLVTPTILPALEDAGYDVSFERLRRDQRAERNVSAPAPDWRAIRRDPRTRSVRLAPDTRLDLGGTAKGWSADVAVSWLARLGPALVDLGGDISATRRRSESWPIAVEHPRAEGEVIDLVLLREGGIATSGRDHRRWKQNGKEQHHLIDPRTGEPARTDVQSATIIASTALGAEIAAKRVVLEGSGPGLKWVESQPHLAALVVLDDGRVLRSTRFSNHVWKEVA